MKNKEKELKELKKLEDTLLKKVDSKAVEEVHRFLEDREKHFIKFIKARRR